jgi:thiamine pyrophosphate-dependent acetolactate synthase large subunit-like protein
MAQTVGTKLPALDFVALAAGHGIEGCRIERPDALAAALRQALDADRPTLVEVVTE